VAISAIIAIAMAASVNTGGRFDEIISVSVLNVRDQLAAKLVRVAGALHA
jgi:hypothetical protein